MAPNISLHSREMIYFSVAEAVKFIFYDFSSRIVASSRDVDMHFNRHTTFRQL